MGRGVTPSIKIPEKFNWEIPKAGGICLRHAQQKDSFGILMMTFIPKSWMIVSVDQQKLRLSHSTY
jgi:hypothetical protein